jgi:4-hydroxybenzoyl-CoA thioesterase
VFAYERPVGFEDVDAAGIVFFSRFFGYCHEAMEAMLAPLDGGYARLIVTRKLGLPAVHVEADFRSPLRFGDVVRIETTVERLGTSSVALRFDLARGADAIATIRHVVVLTNLETMRSAPLPDDVRAVLARHAATT